MSNATQTRVQSHLYGDTELEVQRLSHTFSSLLSKIQQSMEKQGTSVDAFTSHLRGVKGLERMLMYSQRSLVHACMDQIQSQKTIGDIFPLISGYFSWFNHLPVEKMVRAFCASDSEVMSLYRTFKTQFEDFCAQSASECRANSFGFNRSKDAGELIVKFDVMGKMARVSDLIAIRNIIALFLKIKKEALYLSRVECGLVTEVTFLCPLFVCEAAFPLQSEQERSLAGEGGILQLVCGEYSFSSPLWSGDEGSQTNMSMADSMFFMSMMTVGGGECMYTTD